MRLLITLRSKEVISQNAPGYVLSMKYKTRVRCPDENKVWLPLFNCDLSDPNQRLFVTLSSFYRHGAICIIRLCAKCSRRNLRDVAWSIRDRCQQLAR